MREIGGYFELERGPYAPLHGGVLLNSGRSALRLIVRLLKITRIHVPYYTCPVVHEALKAERCVVDHYELDKLFMPSKPFRKDDFILANDYFGLKGGNIAQLASEYPNLIVDNAQSYFANPLGRAAFYSPRKFMGLPDGGIAVFNRDEVTIQGDSDLEKDQSFMRMASLLKRHDLGPAAGYADFKAVAHQLCDTPVLGMSNLTRAILSTINTKNICSRRLANFSYLLNRLKTGFPINPLPESAPLVYPLVSSDQTLRQRLIESRIFVATYWPGLVNCDWLVNDIIPLPIDQRYGEDDMKRIIGVINS